MIASDKGDLLAINDPVIRTLSRFKLVNAGNWIPPNRLSRLPDELADDGVRNGPTGRRGARSVSHAFSGLFLAHIEAGRLFLEEMAVMLPSSNE